MRQTGIAEGLLDFLRDRAAFAGDQRRSDAPGRAWEDGRDPPGHLGAQMPQILAPSAFGFHAGDPMSGAKSVADPANSGEIELALEVAPAGQNLGRHRVQHRLEPDTVARVELVAGPRN